MGLVGLEPTVYRLKADYISHYVIDPQSKEFFILFFHLATPLNGKTTKPQVKTLKVEKYL